MAAPNAKNVRFIPGKLVKDPTNLGTTYPYGGTELGLTTAILFKPGVRSRIHFAEEFGGAHIENTFVGELVMLSLVLRGFDPDALARVFPNVSTGTITGKPGIDGRVSSGSNLPGYRMSNKAFKLLWVPDDLVDTEALIIYNAIPGVEETAALAMSVSEEFGTPVFFLGAPDTTKRVYKLAPFDDLVL